MTALRQKMIEDMQLHGFAERTQEAYLSAVRQLAKHYRKSPDQIDEEGLVRFKHFMTGYEGFDPTLWFLAMAGEEVAGICLCRPQAYADPEMGHVSSLGVRRQWRKRGLGLALLRHAFGEFYRRGKRKVSLGVDAKNLTGALDLYKRAGMHIHLAVDHYEKEIRPGQEISVQSPGDSNA